MHECATCGYPHEFPTAPVDLVDESGGAAEEVAEAAVQIAEIQADRDIKLAKIDNERRDADLVEDNAALRAEVLALREAVDALVAAAAPPEPIVIEAGPEPELEPDMGVVVEAPEPDAEPAAVGGGGRRKKTAWGY